jgi:signal transduction histidine kinase/ActR/RegA family two-component response regulator
MSTPGEHLDDRVLLMAPTRKDATITRSLLQANGISAEVCHSFDVALAELERGAAAIVIPEETVTAANAARLSDLLRRQPPWSDLPVLVLSRIGADSPEAHTAVQTLGNVTLLERPVRVATLLSAVRTALRARQRQYQIREHLSERARTEAALRDADQRKDEFLATLSHELRNPLAPLVSGLDVLRMTITPSVETVRILGVMDRQVRHLRRLVDDLLELSRVTRGLTSVRHDPLDLVSVVRGALDTTRPIFDAAHQEVITDLPDRAVPVLGDTVRLSQVFANLFINAAKYTGAGGRIFVTVRRLENRAIVSVRDTGIGIDPSHLTSIFDMFIQVDRANRRAQGGLGIGLTLARSLVHMHGGIVRAHSEGLGHGSEFTVELPALAASALADDVPAEMPSSLPDRRILVVDDNRDAANIVAALLRTLGATVQVANSGRDALDVLKDFQPDAILLDIGMPEMDGLEVARRIRAAESGGHRSLLVALTGWGQTHDIEQSRAAGFDYHFVKPLNVDALRDALMARPGLSSREGSPDAEHVPKQAPAR